MPVTLMMVGDTRQRGLCPCYNTPPARPDMDRRASWAKSGSGSAPKRLESAGSKMTEDRDGRVDQPGRSHTVSTMSVRVPGLRFEARLGTVVCWGRAGCGCWLCILPRNGAVRGIVNLCFDRGGVGGKLRWWGRLGVDWITCTVNRW